MKIFKLTYNELVKQFKKPSIKIIFALILISAMVLPFAISKIPTNVYRSSNLEYAKFRLQDAEQTADSLKDEKTQKGKIQYKYALIEKENAQLEVDYEVEYQDWRGVELDALRSVSYRLANIESVLNGYNRDVIMEQLTNDDPKVVNSYFDMKLADKKAIEAELITKKERIKTILANNDYMGHTQEEINRQRERIASFEKDLDEYEKLKAKKSLKEEEKARLEELEKDVDRLKNLIVEYNQDIEIMQFRLDNKIDYEKTNWKNNSIKTVENEIFELRIPLLPEKEYSTQASMQGLQMTYDEYVKSYHEKNQARVNKIKEIWYGLENNIPALDDIKDARNVLDSTYEIYIILAVIMVIIIGGGIVATEFSKGTIRLLLIRPVSRWKILFSKLLAVLLVGFGIVVLGIGILYVSSGAVFGFETYNTPLLSTVNGAIVQSTYISFLIPKIILSSASLVFITSLVFAISTLAKNTALAVAISMILYLGTTFVTDLIVQMGGSWITSTFVPYINSSYFRLVPMTEEALAKNFGLQMQYQSGAIQLLVISIVILAITFAVFTKKDVKN